MKPRNKLKLKSIILMSLVSVFILGGILNINAGRNNVSSEIPVIKAELISEDLITALPGDEIKIEYKINAEDFEYDGGINNGKNDVIIVMDTSKYMKQGRNYVETIIDGIQILTQETDGNKTEYAIITYDEKSNDKYGYFTSDFNHIQTKILPDIKSYSYSSDEKNIGNTFEDIDAIFQNGRESANKNIVFISSGKVNYSSEELNCIKNKGYNIICVSADVSDDIETNKEIKELYEELNDGLNNHYLDTSKRPDQPHEAIREVIGVDILKILRDMENNIYNPIYAFNPKLQISLGNNFTHIDGFSSIDKDTNIATIDIDPIIYEHQGDGKYTAKETPTVEFTVKVNEDKYGQLQFNPIDQNIIQYESLHDNNKKILNHIETPTIISAPISATLSSPNPVTSKLNENIELKYKIEAKEFEYDISQNADKNDVVIVLDVSKNMVDKKYFEVARDALKILLDDMELEDNETQYGMVTYSYTHNKDKTGIVIDLTSDTKEIKNGLDKIDPSDTNTDNNARVGDAFDDINSILEKGRVDANKNVLFISSGTVHNWNDNQIEELKAKGYNVISVAANDNGKSKESLKDLHEALEGKEYNYWNAKAKEDELEQIIIEYAPKAIIQSNMEQTYQFNPKLEMILGDNFTDVENISNEGIVNIPTITYNYIGNGKYVPNEEQEELEIEFKVKPNKLGELKFQPLDKNTIQYNMPDNMAISLGIETPTVDVVEGIDIDLKHGRYNGIVGESISITESIITVTNGTYDNLIATGTINSNTTNIELGIDKNIDTEDIDDIKVYKFEQVGNSYKLNSMKRNVERISSKNNQNNYKIELQEDINQNTIIAITYNIKMDYNEGDYINVIKFDDIEKDLKVKNSISSLPDLF